MTDDLASFPALKEIRVRAPTRKRPSERETGHNVQRWAGYADRACKKLVLQSPGELDTWGRVLSYFILSRDFHTQCIHSLPYFSQES